MIDENIATLNEVIKKDASASDAYVKRGAARVISYAYTSALRTDAEGLLEQAVEDFTTAIDLDPSNASAYIGRGEAYDQWKQKDVAFQDYEAAIKLLDESLGRDPRSVDALANRAYAYSGMDEYDEVIQDLDAAIELDPRNPRILISRSLAHSWKGDIDAAIRDLETAIRLDPNSSIAYNIRGSIHMETNEFDKALEDFDKAITLNPNYRWAYGNRGYVYYLTGDYERAIQDYGKAISIRPFSVAYRNRGESQLLQWRIRQSDSRLQFRH